MSTKKIRSILTAVLTPGASMPRADDARAALEELEAIEKVAVEWVVSDHGELSEKASDVMCAISNEVIIRKESGT